MLFILLHLLLYSTQDTNNQHIAIKYTATRDTLPVIPNPPLHFDTVIVDLCVDRSGAVVSTSINREKSVIRDSTTIEKSIKSAQKYKFEARTEGPEIECGFLQFVFKRR